MLAAFVQSDIGEQTWNAHYDLDIKIVETQAEWTPMQRNFLMMAAAEYGPDAPDNSGTQINTNKW